MARKKKPQPPVDINQRMRQITAKNISGLGYHPEDFGVTGMPQATPAAAALANAQGLTGISNAPISSNGKPPVPSTTIVASNTPASQVLSPEEQNIAQRFLNDPTSVILSAPGGETSAKFLQTLFNTDDNKENVVETVWDGFWKGLSSAYNLVNQAGSWTQSVMPGGIDTFSWDQAGQISYGQAAATVGAGISNQVTDLLGGNEYIGNFIGSEYTRITNPLGLGGSIAAAAPEQPLFARRDFNILDPEQRRRAFEEDVSGKWASGIPDTVFTVFADPFILGGKALKLARIRWVDRPVTTAEDIARLQRELDVTNVGKASAPVANFVKRVTETTEDGKKVLTREDIYNNKVIAASSDRDSLANALYHARDYETGSLILRWAYGDASAFKDLATKRASIADALGNARREELMNQFAMAPRSRNKILDKAKQAAENADNRMKALKASGQEGTIEYQVAVKIRNNANNTYAMLKRGKIDPLTAGTQESVALARQVFRDLVESDKALAKAIGDETAKVGGLYQSLKGAKKGFSANNRFGRYVERSRQRRATAAYQAAASRGRWVEKGGEILRADGTVAADMRRASPLTSSWWKMDEFGNNGFTRTVRLWRWPGEENPSGFIFTKGLGALESVRELRAVLNDISIYSGAKRAVIIDPKKPPVLIGGIARKEQLLGQYMDALNSTTGGANAAQLALEAIENTIRADISAWHGLPAEVSKRVFEKANAERIRVIEEIKNNKGFWVDETGKINKAPWLESHIQNGTYMHNWRAFEKAARRAATDKASMRLSESGVGWIGEKAFHFDQIFQDFWRPLVLMRLGYTQRNTIEGLIRACAATGSLAPVKYAVYNGAFSARNAIVARTGAAAGKSAIKAARLRASGATGIPMPQKFVKWLDREISARDTDVAERFAQITNEGDMIAPFSSEARSMMIDHYKRMQAWAADEIKKATAAGAGRDEIDSLRLTVKEAQDSARRISALKPPKTPSADAALSTDRLKYTIQQLDDSLSRREILDDDLSAAALYLQQGTARRRVFDGIRDFVPGGPVIRQAFDRNSPFTPTALSMLSSDATNKSTLLLNMDNMQRGFRMTRTTHYDRVNPEDANYFDSVANQLRTMQNSQVGQMVIKGKTDDEIASFLVRTKQGREIMEFLTGEKKFSKSDAMEVALDVRAGFEQLAPTDALRNYVRSVQLTDKFSGKQVEAMIGARDAAGKFVEDLKPVIGSTVEKLGFKPTMDAWRSLTGWTMKWLGTIPEDALVRAPFYGMVYEGAMKELVRDFSRQFDSVTPADMEQLMRTAHRRALKDTKDTLYTIDRRTNLGTYGERISPFISAAQNTATTVGKLAWNDPAVAGYLVALWNAPDRMGITDENGNVVIPIWHEMIPDEIEQRVGIDNMKNLKFSKSALNVLIPETGFMGIVPRPGPYVGVLASEIMKHGIFGISVEPPEIMRNIIGEDASNFFWNGMKSWLFGEGQGVDPGTLSQGMIIPPAWQKITQMISGTDSSQFAYWYALQLRSEWLKWGAGMRDSIPDPNEILNQTRGFQLVRWLANLTAITPPQYESMIDPLIEENRRLERQYGSLESSRMFNELYGPFLQMIGDYSNSKNISGMGPNTNAVRAARRYSNLIAKVSPDLENMGDLSVISMLTMSNAGDLYDDSAYAWQFTNSIPGVSDNFRAYQTPEQAWAQSRVNAGWSTYMRKMDELDARLRQSGYTSYRSNDALRMERDNFIASLRDNPMFEGWYEDWNEHGSSRTLSAIKMMTDALQDNTFMADNKENPIWMKAAMYLHFRQVTLDALSQVEGGINNQDNHEIRDFWDQQRANLAASDTEWAAFANRFLNGDDDPQQPGVSFGKTYEAPMEEVA